MKLSRADVEWLLATHENGRGPVDWSDESQREREGLYLRGAFLHETSLRELPLARMCAGEDFGNWFEEVQRHQQVEGHLEGVDLSFAHLESVMNFKGNEPL